MAYDPKIIIDNKHRLQGKGFDPGKPVGFDEKGNLVNVDVQTGIPYRKIKVTVSNVSPLTATVTEE